MESVQKNNDLGNKFKTLISGEIQSDVNNKPEDQYSTNYE